MKIVYIICMIALLGAMMIAPAAATDWSTFQKDNYNTGLTSDKAPITNPLGNGISWERSFAFGGWAGFDEAPIVVGDMVYVVGADNKVRAMNKTTGDVKWETSTSGGGFLLGNMGAGNGTIFVPTTDGKIFGIDDATGVVEWSATESGQMNTPVVYGDHKIYFGDWNGNKAYYCYSDTGTEIWQRTSNSGSGYYWAGATTIGDYLVYGDDASHLTSVYKANGTTVHEIDISTEFNVTANEIRSSICYVEYLDRIYFTSKGGYIYALGMNNDGTFDTTDKHHANIGYSTSTPAVYNNKVYVGAGGMYGGGDGISCLDADLTDEDWHFAAAAGAVQSSPAVTTAYDDGDGEVYIYVTTNAAAGKVYCVNESGVEQWSWGESGKTDWTLCGVAISDGWIFYGTDSKYVFGFATTESLSDILPVADFVADVTSGDAPLTVSFTDLSTNDPDTWAWDFDNDGIVDSTVQNPVHTYDATGTYTVSLEVANAYSATETKVDYVVVTAPTPIIPDLTVAAIETPANLRNDVINPISVTIANVGGINAENFDVLLEVDGTQVDAATVATLAAGKNAMVEFLWTPDATGGATLTVTADASDSVEELDETNNDLAETVDVLEKLTVTANVRIEGQDETVWTGDVTFSSSVLTTTDGSIHYLNEPTALGALDEADKLGGFGYVLVDYGWGLYVSEVAGESAIGWDGWMYRVDYASPWVGAADYTLADDDKVLWYFGAWTAPPLTIELNRTTVMTGEAFVVTVTAETVPVDNATVYANELTFQTGPDGTATLALDTAGNYTVYADKGTWANYTRSEKETVTVVMPAGVKFDLKKLDLNSNGIIKAFITLPEGYDVADIDVSTVECEGAHAFGDGSVISGKQALEVKFLIQDLVDVPIGDAVSLSVTGELTTGGRFEGSNTIEVIAK